MSKTRTPLLIIGDGVSSGSGLGRIAGDIASRIDEHMRDVVRVATLGYGSPGSRRFPFQQYFIEGMDDWVIPTLPQVWQDWAGSEKGIVLCVWDISRLGWFSQPKQSELLNDHPVLREMLMKPPFEKWIYTPVDAEGPNGRLSFPIMKSLYGFDRVLAYGEFGERIIEATLSKEESAKRHLTWLPHGIDTDVFYEEDRQLCRKLFLKITGAQPLFGKAEPISDELVIGIVATNQVRKDWALAMETVAILAQTCKVRLWIHTDSMERHWSIPCMLIDHGLTDKALISLGFLSDEKMAQAYSACDVTLGIGPEGFGLPIAESMACRTPVVVGAYGGQSDFVPPHMQVAPVAYRYEGMYTSKRPVYNAFDWAAKVMEIVAKGRGSTLDPSYHWTSLWTRWEAYLREAVK